MLYPENVSDTLSPELFRHPSVHYRGIPFWSWNCKVTRELIDEQLPIFQQMGFGGVDIHPRTGLDTVYLSDEFLDLVRYTVKRCKELGLICWLYDDDRFPSGAADGLVTKDPAYRQRFLLLTETPHPECSVDRDAFDRAAARGEFQKGWHAASYAFNAHAVRRLRKDESPRPGETVRYAYVMLSEPEDWFQGQTYLDIMNPLAVRRFLEITHEAYWQCLGKDFGGTVQAVFTDEPRMETRSKTYPKVLKSSSDHGDVIIPWSSALESRIREEYGADLLDLIPALVLELPESRHARYVFRNAAGEQFVSSFLDQIADWCSEHHILMTGHVLSEDTLSAQAQSLGDCMRCYRRMDIPGIDVLCDDRPFLTVKQASSVAHQMGREGVVSELYGVTEWDCDFKTFKLQGDWQAALGVTVRVSHLSWMSMEGEAKRDWPGSIFYQSPWWKKFSSVEDYFARLNTVLTRGTPIIDLAVIHPVESMWLHLGPAAETQQARQEMDARFDALLRSLLLNLTDFDLLSESLLPEQNPQADRGCLQVGEMQYRTVIVPDLETIRSSTLRMLKDFRESGGQVIFTGRIPNLVDAQPSDLAEQFAAQCEHADTCDRLCQMLRPSLIVLRSDGSNADNLLSQRRRDRDAEWLFLCPAYPGEKNSDTPESYTIHLHGHCAVTEYDARSGTVHPLPVQYEEGDTLVFWTAYAQDSLLLQLLKGTSDTTCTPGLLHRPVQTLTKAQMVSLSEPNMLLLDYARAAVDGHAQTDRMEILRLDNRIRRQLGFLPRYGSMMQPYATKEKEDHRLSLFYHFVSETEGPCELAMEHPERSRIEWNGEEIKAQDTGFYVDRAIRRIPLPRLKTGLNTLRLDMNYNQKTNPENVYVLGDFDVLPGPAGESRILPRSKKTTGDLTQQGLPFYSGKVTYSFQFIIQAPGAYAFRVPSFSAALLEAALDQRPIGIIALAPHRLSLGTLEPGVHTLDITAYIGRHNGFGYLHNSNDHFRWYGPDSWRTSGNEWTDDYRVRPTGILSGVILEKVLPAAPDAAGDTV